MYSENSTKWLSTLLAIYLILLLLFFMWVFFISWPEKMEICPFFYSISPDRRLLIFSLSAAAIGSIFGTFRAFLLPYTSQTFKNSWALFYFINPIFGMLTGAFVYIAIRGGILKTSSEVDSLNPFTVASITAIAGFLSEHIIIRLLKFGNTISSEKKSNRTDNLTGHNQ